MKPLTQCRACVVDGLAPPRVASMPYLTALADGELFTTEKVKAALCDFHRTKLGLMVSAGKETLDAAH